VELGDLEGERSLRWVCEAKEKLRVHLRARWVVLERRQGVGEPRVVQDLEVLEVAGVRVVVPMHLILAFNS
jgi:hypothetical protein